MCVPIFAVRFDMLTALQFSNLQILCHAGFAIPRLCIIRICNPKYFGRIIIRPYKFNNNAKLRNNFKLL